MSYLAKKPLNKSRGFYINFESEIVYPYKPTKLML